MSRDKADELIQQAAAASAELASTEVLHRFDLMRRRCESPIEQQFLAALIWDAATGLKHENIQLFCRTFTFGEAHAWPGPSVDVWLQAVVGDYRADFLFDTLHVDGRRSFVVVECDGHDFHERTKEQASRDKARDRFMARHGITVLRFSGSDIYNDAMKVWAEVSDFVLSPAKPCSAGTI